MDLFTVISICTRGVRARPGLFDLAATIFVQFWCYWTQIKALNMTHNLMKFDFKFKLYKTFKIDHL